VTVAAERRGEERFDAGLGHFDADKARALVKALIPRIGAERGACPAGWKPGDMEMPGMGRVNINEMMSSVTGKTPRK
jgi:hypothetical protein